MKYNWPTISYNGLKTEYSASFTDNKDNNLYYFRGDSTERLSKKQSAAQNLRNLKRLVEYHVEENKEKNIVIDKIYLGVDNLRDLRNWLIEIYGPKGIDNLSRNFNDFIITSKINRLIIYGLKIIPTEKEFEIRFGRAKTEKIIF